MTLLAKSGVAVLALTFALSAFAAEKSLTVYTDSTLNGQKVAAGDYKVDYEINGSNAEVKLLKNKKTVATATGQVVAKDTPSDQTAVVRSQNADGSSSIVEIDLAKEKSVIRFAPEMTAKGQ
jgi:hypothetical protein